MLQLHYVAIIDLRHFITHTILGIIVKILNLVLFVYKYSKLQSPKYLHVTNHVENTSMWLLFESLAMVI